MSFATVGPLLWRGSPGGVGIEESDLSVEGITAGDCEWVNGARAGSRSLRTVQPVCVKAGLARILIDLLLSNDPSWDKGWIDSRAGEDSTQGGVR